MNITLRPLQAIGMSWHFYTKRMALQHSGDGPNFSLLLVLISVNRKYKDGSISLENSNTFGKSKIRSLNL